VSADGSRAAVPHKWYAFDGHVVDDVRVDPFVAGAAWQAAQPVVVSRERLLAARDLVWSDESLVHGDGPSAFAFAVIKALGITVEPTSAMVK
jgi:hypothetical protein